MKKKLFIRTFGCQMNVHDSEKLQKLLADDYELTDGPAEADLVIVNTCSVREKPEHKLYSYLGELSVHKREKSGMLIVVCGCVAQQWGEVILKKSADVDLVIGTHNIVRIRDLLTLREETGQRQVAVDFSSSWDALPAGSVNNSEASVYVAISRGCNKHCAYCIVPYTRGKESSRPAEEILAEAELATSNGAREIYLLGQTVNSYGRDLGNGISFAGLLEKIAGIDGVKRIRFASPHPQEVKDDFYKLFKNEKKICPHVHMPLQSGSDNILKLMKRSYSRERYLEIISRLREAVPELAVTTDLIVGFPGETDSDFRDTLDLMRKVEFDGSFSFMFSPRPGTPAADMDGQIEEALKLERLQELQRLQAELASKRLDTYLDTQTEILIDRPSHHDKSVMQGRTPQNTVLNLEEAYPDLKPGMIVPVKVTGRGRNTLKGLILN